MRGDAKCVKNASKKMVKRFVEEDMSSKRRALGGFWKMKHNAIFNGTIDDVRISRVCSASIASSFGFMPDLRASLARSCAS
ncbi:MAG: hypothetical protein KKA61_02735 [Nanoarchaeota archaeon]|nr:hypothetical protein [Nanoarchaeota archaeon]